MTVDRRQLVTGTLRHHGPLAPPELRASVEAAISRAAERRRLPLKPALAFALAVTLAALAIAIALPLGNNAPTAVKVHQISGDRATAATPVALSGHPELLDRKLDGVSFPNWRKEFGWRAAGSRSDDLDGRRTATVFYRHTTHRIAYTIVSGKPLDVPGGAEHLTVRGVDLYRFRHGGHDVVMFERGGRTCVLSGHVKHRHTLVKLAAWKGDGRISF
jgi:hypothetical protein